MSVDVDTVPAPAEAADAPAPGDSWQELERRRRRRRWWTGGGRWLVFLGRGLLWAAVAVVLLNGVAVLLRPPPPVSPPLTAPAAAGERFPADAAAAFAVRFASDYLTWDADTAGVREASLRAYLAAGVDAQAGWDRRGRQVAGLVLPVAVDALDDHRAVVTVAAAVTGRDAPRWVHLAVPVATDGAGGLAVTAAPAFVAAPPAAEVDPAGPAVQTDARAAAALRAPLEAFFRAYAAGDGADLAYFLADGAQVRGLGGAVGFEALSRLSVAAGGARREVLAEVRWHDEVTGASVEQGYELLVARRGDRWYIERLGAAVAGRGSDTGDG